MMDLAVNKLKLPTKYLSWSQISKWGKTKTHRDYIKYYFFKDKEIFENDYLLFGSYISDLLENNTDISKESEMVQEVVSHLDLLGNPETRLMIDFDEFSVIGYADDASDDCKHIREWKTGAMWTQEKVDNHGQLDTYASAVHKKYGYIPEIILTSMEVKPSDESCVIVDGKSLQVCFTGKVEHFERKVTEKDIERIDKLYNDSAREIAYYWEIFSRLAEL